MLVNRRKLVKCISSQAQSETSSGTKYLPMTIIWEASTAVWQNAMVIIHLPRRNPGTKAPALSLNGEMPLKSSRWLGADMNYFYIIIRGNTTTDKRDKFTIFPLCPARSRLWIWLVAKMGILMTFDDSNNYGLWPIGLCTTGSCYPPSQEFQHSSVETLFIIEQ